METPAAELASPPRRARRGATALLALGALGAAVGLGEIAVRLLLPTPLALRVEAAAGRGEASGLPDEFLYQRDARGVTLRPNADLVLRDHPLSRRDVHLRTNALGHRGPDLGPRRPGDLRILVLGDSITLGDYVAEDETYPAWIERRLREARAPDAPGRVDVINAGVGSVGIDDLVARLVHGGAEAAPDLVVVGLYLNDADASSFVPPLRLPGLLHRSHLAHEIATRLQLLAGQEALEQRRERRRRAAEDYLAMHGGRGFDGEVLDAFWDWGYAWSDESWDAIEQGVRALQREAWERGFRLALVLHPVRLQVESDELRDEPQQRFADLARRLDLPSLDLLPALRTAARETPAALYYDHCHYTPEGNRVVGLRIADWLRERVLVERPDAG